MILIGIDPGVKTGFAVTKDKKIIEILTLDFWKTIERINYYHQLGDRVKIYIENPNGNKPVFVKAGANSSQSYVKIGQNVGSNKREASLLIEYCKINNIEVVPVIPKKKAISSGKIKEGYFKKITGYDKRCSQHGRDALMLIFGL